MATQGVEYRPVRDSVPMIDGEVAVGEDIEFQRSWWKFEKAVWIIFSLIIVADLTGILGRGPLANVRRSTSDGALTVKYERVLRANTSSMITILPQAATIHDNKVQVFVSDPVLKKLGAQRVIPQPQSSVVGNGGVTYTFPVTALPMTVQIELKPSFIGPEHFTVGIPGAQSIQAKTFTLP